MKRIGVVCLFLTLAIGSSYSSAEDSPERQLLYELIDRIEQLEGEVRQLRGQQEVVTYRQEEAARRGAKRAEDSDRRLLRLEQTAGLETAAPAVSRDTAPAQRTGSVAVTGAGAAASAGGSAAARPSATADEKAAYERTFGMLREGAFEDAIIGFNQFLFKYPNGAYADNSQYWLGEAFYVTRDFEQAQMAFQKVIDSFPDSQKVPDAKLKLGFTMHELNRDSEARKILEGVVKDYPESSVARLAERRLKEI